MPIATKRPNTKHRQRGAGRQDILKAALDEFSAKGYAGATTAGIARLAGVTQPLIHHHFSSKRLLWEAVLLDIYDDYQRMSVAIEPAPVNSSLLEQMKAGLRAYILFSSSHSKLARIIVIESARGGETFDFLYEKYLKPEIQALQKVLQEGRDAGLIRNIDPVMLPFLITGAGVHPFVVPETIHRMTGLNPLTPQTALQYADMVIDALFNGLLINPEDT